MNCRYETLRHSEPPHRPVGPAHQLMPHRQYRLSLISHGLPVVRLDFLSFPRIRQFIQNRHMNIRLVIDHIMNKIEPIKPAPPVTMILFIL